MSKVEKKSNKQKTVKSSGRGGKRPGAGRPPGSTDFLKLRDCVTEEQIADVLEAYLANAIKDPNTNRHFIEQVFGKAKQTIAGDEDNPLVAVSNYFEGAAKLAKKYEDELKKEIEDKT